MDLNLLLGRVHFSPCSLCTLHPAAVVSRVWSACDPLAGKTLGSSSAIVRREDLLTACGDAANDLKSYQLVGINFLMMLHRSGTVGEQS